MKVCLIVEGAYPYVTGGVSSWVQQLITNMSDVEFVVQTIAARPNQKQRFAYEMPSNVSEIQEVYLLDDDYIGKKTQKRIRLTKEEYDAFEGLMFANSTDWKVIMNFFAKKEVSLNAILSGKDFFNITKDYYNENFNRVVFSDFLWTMRSLYLPLFTILKSRTEKADLYHSVSNGYAGVWGSLQKNITGSPFLMTEHGLYIREREEEIIKASWVSGIYKELWIQQFKRIGECCYDYADKVVSLFEGAREFQIELGCDKEKTLVIPNGVNVSHFEQIPGKEADDEYINIGAVLRVTPIKDVKTLISAYALAKKVNPKLKLWIMGGMDEVKEYADECRQMVVDMDVKDVVFTGVINVKEYLGKMDFTILTSLSEGQPISILESFACKKPCIATNVGNCKGLIEGERDTLGNAGFVVSVMGVNEIARAILEMAKSETERKRMGQIGYERVSTDYSQSMVFEKYRELYEQLTNTGKKV